VVVGVKRTKEEKRLEEGRRSAEQGKLNDRRRKEA
jgi:hypothetical protein